MMVNLSKSRIMAGLQCPKRLYLQVYNPDLAGELDQGSRLTLDQGREVGRLAQKMFPGGLLIETGDDLNLGKALELTREAVSMPHVPAVFEATFQLDGILVRADILERRRNAEWRLIEVKSGTEVKEHYVYDVALQHFVLDACGIKAAPALMHLNREYVFDGNHYALEKLFCIEDLSREVAALTKSVPELIQRLRRALAQAQPPEVEAGPQCAKPVTCEFYDVCNKPLPDDHIARLPNLSPQKLEELKAMGVELIAQIPQTFPLTERQQHACECVKTGSTWFGSGITERLAELEYPIHFMDFETLMLALPRFAGMHPYDQLPFQWSVHVRRSPSAELEHYEFLAEIETDPRPLFTQSLCQTLGARGSIVVYNQAFESGRLSELAGWLPQHAGTIAGIQGRLWDLLPVVRSGVYHPRFGGSYSLKSVLPALVPDLSYRGMLVAEGGEAGLAWERIVRGNLASDERNRLRAALLAYCEQDTLALARLLDVISRA
ncbi:MAG: DUF2779 domain-containing protein [Terriglobia bacterium]